MASDDQNRRTFGRVQIIRHWGEVLPVEVDDRLNEYAYDLGLRPVSGENNATVQPLGNDGRNNREDNMQGSNIRRITPSVTLRLTFPSLDSLLTTDHTLEEAFCGCYKDKSRELQCSCGEDDAAFDWVWDISSKSFAAQIQNFNREVCFHTEYSCGTASVRGNSPMISDQHYWEIKMTSPVYGTDMMVGIGTGEVDLNRHRYTFCSFLGSDCETWGLSYTGLFHHKGQSHCYCPRFGQGSIIGVHLDMWNGTLSFYKNRQPLGVACSGLKGKTIFPMVSSTAARSGMKVIRSRSFNSSLQYLCCLVLRKAIPPETGVLDALKLPPGLAAFLANNLSWLLDPISAVKRKDLSTSSKMDGYKQLFHSRIRSTNQAFETSSSSTSSTLPSRKMHPEIVPSIALKPTVKFTTRTRACLCSDTKCKKRKHTLYEYENGGSSSSESEIELPELSSFKRKHSK